MVLYFANKVGPIKKAKAWKCQNNITFTRGSLAMFAAYLELYLLCFYSIYFCETFTFQILI